MKGQEKINAADLGITQMVAGFIANAIMPFDMMVLEMMDPDSTDL